MEQINKIELAGRVGTVRINRVGERSVCNFSVATTYMYKAQDNTPVEEVSWHNCTIWSGKKFSDFDFLKVGLPVHLFGRMKMTKYTGQDGVDRVSYDVMVNDLDVLSDKEQLTPVSSL